MFRIEITWNFISPVLKVVSGIVKVHYIKNITNWELLTEFKVKCENHSLGYHELSEGKGIPTLVLDAIKPQLDMIVRSYLDGLNLEKHSCFWIDKHDQELSKIKQDQLEKNLEQKEKSK